MKRILLLSIGAAFFGAVSAQEIASKDPKNKNVVLEEFTGKTCGYCPDGHKKADEFSAANPGRVVLINVHCGSYASGTPNYNVMVGGANYGNALYGQPGVDLKGFPAGTVNRTLFSGTSQGSGTAQSRGTWATTGATVMSQPSPVNVGVKAIYDKVKLKLYVIVEAYYTFDETNATNRINVGIVQDGIWGPQSGATSYYPAKVDQSKAPNIYRHDHMLRAVLTGQWGETITETKKGSLFTKTYEWDMVAKIGDADVDPSKLHVYAFVSEGQQNAITGEITAVVEAAGEVDPTNPNNVLSVVEEGNFSGVRLYPNPTFGKSTLTFSSNVEDNAQVRVISVTGQEMASFSSDVNVGDNTINIDLTSYETGYYFIEVTGESGVITRQQVIKK